MKTENKTLKIREKNIFICEDHHQVLQFWHAYKDSCPYLLTFDHHTDLHLAFNHYIYHNGEKEKTWEEQRKALLDGISANDPSAIEKLTHAEHIDAAIKTGIIKKALVYSENSYYSRQEEVYTIDGNSQYAGQNIINNCNYIEMQSLISSETLSSNFKKFDLCIPKSQWFHNYILDIDLDFFKSTKSFENKDLTFFKNLIDNCIAVSIATEPIFVKGWQEEYDSMLTVEYLLDKILKIIAA